MEGVGVHNCNHNIWKAVGRRLKVLGQLDLQREVQADRYIEIPYLKRKSNISLKI